MFATAILLSGCWVRLPSHGPEAINRLVGTSVTATKVIYIFDAGDGSRFGTSERQPGFIASVPVRTKLNVSSIVSRRKPSGLIYYAVLHPASSDLPSFDYIIGFGRAPLPVTDSSLSWSGLAEGARR